MAGRLAVVQAEPESPQGPASPICDLSDDEQPADQPPPAVPLAGRSRKREKSLSQIDESKVISQENQALRRIVCSNCRCKMPSCRQIWRDDADAFQSLLKLRCRWQQISKTDVDSEASRFYEYPMILFAFFVVLCGDDFQQLAS